MMKGILTLGLLGLLSSTYAVEKSQCGPTNDRVLSYDLAIGRMLQTTDASAGCTGTMISKTCVVSAGHCQPYSNVIEFNTEASVGGKIVHPGPESIYFRNDVIDYQNGGAGNDWLVYRVKPNAITGEYAGDVQGTYQFTYEMPAAPLDLVITGYGRDRRPEHNFAQQIGYGELISASGTTLGHKVDTEGGNSGSVIVERTSNSIIGIHTHGGCGYGTNKGTMLAAHKRFQEAIESCLRMEKDDLNQ